MKNILLVVPASALLHAADGAIVRPTGGGGGATIQNGVSKHVAQGDIVLIPPGVPHWDTDLDGTITYPEVRWEEK
jgi:uncharacterized RmlC-like cupin family protein